MVFPWANTLILVFAAAELISGYFGLVSGSSDRAIYMQVHRAAGYGIVLLLLWKGRNIAFSLRRRSPRAPRTASLVLLLALLTTLALGFAWAFAGRFHFLGFSGVSWHIYAGAALAPILIWHTVHQTRGFRLRYWTERRSVLRLAGLAVAGFALWQAGELVARGASLAGADRRFTGSHEFERSGPGVFPVVSWLNDDPDPVDAETWKLSLRGPSGERVSLDYADLASASELTATIDCTGGWYSTQAWRGVPVAELLAALDPPAEARSVTFTSVTGYYRRFPIEAAGRFLLATHVGDRVLSHGHGYPMRLVAPGRRGFEWVKWVTSMEVDAKPAWLQPPLPVQ